MEHHREKEPIDIEYAVATLRTAMPHVARQLIVARHDTSCCFEYGFWNDPDNPVEHSPKWHQYGILTHSEEFRKFMSGGVPLMAERWGLAHTIMPALAEKIDGTSKEDLLQVVSLLHDVGKFTARTLEYEEDGSVQAKFTRHEAHSRTIIQDNLHDTLQSLGLSSEQIAYVARCAGHHFDLGKARRAARDKGGYTMKFARSHEFKRIAVEMIEDQPEIALEVGLMFIADSLSKTEIAATATTDEGIVAQRQGLKEEIIRKDLHSRLIHQALQQPVNLEIGRQYLQVWSASCA